MTSEQILQDQLRLDLRATSVIYRRWADEVGQWQDIDEQTRQQVRGVAEEVAAAVERLSAALG